MPHPATRRVRRAIALIERRGTWLMARRAGPLLEGLWEPPGVELAGRRSARRALGASLAALGVRARLTRRGGTLRHRITHRALEVECWIGRLVGPVPRRSDLRYVDPRAPSVAITALARRAWRAFVVS